MTPRLAFLSLSLAAGLAGCYSMRSSQGGGQTTFSQPRRLDPDCIALPSGYRIERVITGLTFPAGIAFDDQNRPHIVEAGYCYGEVWTTPRLLRLEPGERKVEVARGGGNGPWNGVAYHEGAFYVAEGGRRQGGAILRIALQGAEDTEAGEAGEGAVTRLIDGLPSRGDHHVNGPLFGPDGWLYFSIGTATNSGVVGEDNIQFGWVKDAPAFHDVPCEDITLMGENFSTKSPFAEGSEVETGAFVPYGTRTERGQRIPGELPCSGAILRMRPEPGAKPELVAWGFRNPFGLAFAPDGRLFATDNSYDVRGCRPVYGSGDLLWEVKPGTWYGWPDFHGTRPLDRGDRYEPPGRDAPKPLLAAHPNIPPEPAAILPVHSSSDGLDFSRNPVFGFEGHAFVAQFGDQAPAVGKVLSPVGYKVVRVDVSTGVSEDFAVNKGKTNGPASWLGLDGFERPVAARFDRDGTALWVVDFGVVLQEGSRTDPQMGTGSVWKITRDAGLIAERREP